MSEKLMSLLIAFALALSMSPSAAWAEGQREAAALETEQAAVEVAVGDQPAEPGESDASAEAQEDRPGASSGGSEAERDAAENGAESVLPESVLPGVEPNVTSGANAANDKASALSLDESGSVLIQDEQDLDDSHSYVRGELGVGKTLWANAYDYDDWAIPHESSWTYQWLSGDSQYADDDAFSPIAGQTAQSLMLTEELASQLSGKYLRVKITDGGATLTGPAAYRTPGPAVKPGVVNLGWAHVVAAEADLSGYATSVKDAASVHAGDTLYAGAWKTGAASAVLRSSDGVAFSWQMAGGDGAFSVKGTGDTFEVPAGSEGQSLRVVADGGGTTKTTGTVKIVDEGAVELKSVTIDKPDSLETGTTLTAHAFEPGSSSWVTGPEATEGVTYTWKRLDAAAGSGSTWTPIEGATSSTFTVTDDYAGCSFIVEATAGANTVALSSYNAVGPFKKAGTYDVYSAAVRANGETSAKVQAGDTVSVYAREKTVNGSGGTVCNDIPSDKLTYTWQVSDRRGGTYVDLSDANLHAASFAVPDTEAYVGKSLRCIVNGGVADKATAGTNPIASSDAVSVSRVEFESSSGLPGALAPGDTLTARAFDADGNDVTSRVTSWSWYTNTASSNYGSAKTKIEGAEGIAFTVPSDDKDYAGKYIVVNTVDGFGSTSFAISSKVSVPGSVELFKVEATGSPKVGQTLTAMAYKLNQHNASTPVGSSDTVMYQWQYAPRSTTSDSAFSDIPGATGSTYVVGSALPDGTSLVGSYLRVRVQSGNGVVSTQKPYYGSTLAVDPLGPVAQEGVYELSSVRLDAFTAEMGDGQGFQVGNTIVPQAMVPSGPYAEVPVPADAKLAYAWYVADSPDSQGQKLESGYDSADGRLKLTDDLKGCYLRVEANSLDNTVSSSDNEYGARIANYLVVGSGEYELLRVTVSPSSGDVFPGDTLHATVQARKLNSGTGVGATGELLPRFEGCAWYLGDDADGSFSRIEGATETSFVVPSAAAGRYVKAVATSGASTVERVLDNFVIGTDTLESAAQKLSASSFRPDPVFGASENVNELMEAELARLGYEGVKVATKAASTNVGAEPNALVGVSSADDETNGNVTFFYVDPDERESQLDYSALRQVELTFVFIRGAESFDTSATYAPRIVVPWDDGKVTELLEKRCKNLAVGLADGDSLKALTQDVVLPHRLSDDAGTAFAWSTVSWSSSDEGAIGIVEQGRFQDCRGAVVRSSEDRRVSLTATVGVVASGGPETVVGKTFEVTVKGDSGGIDEAKRALQQKVDANFVYANIADRETHGAIDQKAVAGDLSLPDQGALGVGGGDYRVEYRASSDVFEIDGFAANAYRPLPAAAPASSDITVTVTDKRNEQVTASKTLSFTVLPLEQKAIERELALMDEAKAAYATAILNGQAADAVTGNLHPFQKATSDDDGSLTWSYDRASAEAAGYGIVPVELEGYDDMGSAGWRLFRSSEPAVVSHENLLVTRSAYNARITVDSRLSSEKYARYAVRYPADETFQKLANQGVSATFTVAGTSGQDDPRVSATCSVIGIDADGNRQTWAAASPYVFDKGATAADLSDAMFKAAGIKADIDRSKGWYLQSITSPFDRYLTLAWDQATGRYWQLFVNGEAASSGAGDIVLQPNDNAVWFFSAWGDPAPTDQLSVSVSVVGVDADGAAQTWASPCAIPMEEGATAADLSEKAFEQAGIVADISKNGGGWFLQRLASPYDASNVLGWNEETGAYWQLFINGEYAQVGALDHTLKAGDSVTWCYGSDGTLPGEIKTSGKVLGLDAGGSVQAWTSKTSFSVVEGTTASTFSEQLFARASLRVFVDRGNDGWTVASVASPYEGGSTLANETASSSKNPRVWRLFVNGVLETDPTSQKLSADDEVVWCYTAGDALPDEGAVVDPNAPRPSYDAEWPGFSNGMSGTAVKSPTPTESTELAWSYNFREGGGGVSVSDPLIVNGRLYLVVAGELRIVDAKTGEVERRASVGSSSAYFNRPAYTDGIVIVPSDNGSLAAFTADTLTCVWRTKPLETTSGESFQSLSSLTVAGWRVYAGFTVVGKGEATDRGVLMCVDVRDGSVVWTKDEGAAAGSSMGYYWVGAAASGSDIVIGDDAGRVRLLDGLSGETLSSIDVGAPVRTGVVAVSEKDARAATGETFVVVTHDGSMHKIERSGDMLKSVGSASFAGKSASTPTIANGRAFVGAADSDGYGTLSVIDLATMAVERTVRGGFGEAQGSPLVSVQGDGVYAYFTCNGRPGGVYGYRLGDESAYLLYAPPAGQQQYSTSSIIAGADGTLYYTNDSGVLFALKGAESVEVSFRTGGGSYIAPYRAALGKPLVRPDDPVRAGYVFGGWFVDEGCTRAWDFSGPATSEVTLYAKWAKKYDGQGGGAPGGSGGAGSSDPLQPAAPFAKPLPTGGALAATQAPLSQEATRDAKAGKADKVDEVTRPEVRTTSGTGVDADNGSSDGTSAGVNPFAMGGVALGVVGLIGATFYAARTRRRNSEV